MWVSVWVNSSHGSTQTFIVDEIKQNMSHQKRLGSCPARPIPEGMTIFCLVALCIVAKRYVLAENCLKEWIGNQGQRVDFLGRHRISTSGFAYMATETAVFAVRSAKPCFSWASCYILLPSGHKKWVCPVFQKVCGSEPLSPLKLRLWQLTISTCYSTKPWPQSTCTENLAKFGMWFLRYASKHTNTLGWKCEWYIPLANGGP